MKFRKKPVVIEAVQWNGKNIADIDKQNPSRQYSYGTDGNLEIYTLEGTMIAKPGDWIIWGVKGEMYPCKPNIFEATYEPV